MPPATTSASPRRRRSTWRRRVTDAASSALAAAVFALLDIVDVLLCPAYALLDGVLEESPVRCYCGTDGGAGDEGEGEGEGEVSDTLYARRSAVRDALLRLLRPAVAVRKIRRPPTCNKWRSPRWSDCGCKSCVAWRAGEGRLHIVVKEPDPPKGTESSAEKEEENAIFVHGFTSSSSLWAETVFPLLNSSNRCRLVAVDLLGFGQSPKPASCLYTLRDHVEAIERTLLVPHHLMMSSSSSSSSSFHLVAHSMGCIIALALAAKHPTRVKSITLVAPPYFPRCDGQEALRRLAEKKLWPPLLFGSAVMSWYEHIGRTVCFLVCRNHRLWECLLRLLTGNRDVDFRVRDVTRHTHHSAWHTMHNVICGGARLQDANLEAVEAAGIPVMAVHGGDDAVVPVECSRHLKAKLPRADLRLVPGCDHTTVLSGGPRGRGFAQELTAFWSRARSS